MKVKIGEVTEYLETLAPRAYQESYDNAGLITGHPQREITSVLVTLDCTEEVVEEAIRKGSNLIVAHHPILFRPIRSLVPNNYVTRALELAIKGDIAIFASHTNLDNVHWGVSREMAAQLGLGSTRVLEPKMNTLSKLVTFIPSAQANSVVAALFAAGAGQVGKYKDCSFQIEGVGTFTPDAEAKPHVGKPGQPERAEEVRVEVLLPRHRESEILSALQAAHPYEEVAYYLTPLQNQNQDVGAGVIGELPHPVPALEFLRKVKSTFGCGVIRHTAIAKDFVRRIALCGGAGSFLLPRAVQAGADVFLSADFKYHEFFDAEGKLLIADIGHYESERFTPRLLGEVLARKFPTFAVNFSETPTNPIHYL